MISFRFVRHAGLVLSLALGLVFAQSANAQEPPAASVALAKELITVKGGNLMTDPIIPGVIESAKNILLQTSPMLGKDLNEVAAQLRKEYDPKREELLTQMARAYAQKFSEQELKDLVAFYKSPLGKKMITTEPAIIDDSMSMTQNWASQFSQQVLGRMRQDMKKRGHDL